MRHSFLATVEWKGFGILRNLTERHRTAFLKRLHIITFIIETMDRWVRVIFSCHKEATQVHRRISTAVKMVITNFTSDASQKTNEQKHCSGD